MKKHLLLLAMCVTLVGCASATATYTSSGQKGFLIDCSTRGGFQQNWGNCYKKAGEMCGENGYKVIEKPKDDDKDTHIFFGDASTVNRTMIIQCK